MNVIATAAMLVAPALGPGAALALGMDTSQPQFIQGRQCSQRVGPFATQDRAWAVWRQSRDEANWRGPAYGVSNGVVPCWEQNSRGYCFFVFYPC